MLVRHTYGRKLWVFPGGGIKKNEQALAAVQREMKEELGIELKNLKEVGQFVSDCEGLKDKVTVFVADPWGEIKSDTTEILEYKWVKPGDLSGMKLGFNTKKVWQLYSKRKRLA